MTNQCDHTPLYVADSVGRELQVGCPWCKDTEIEQLRAALKGLSDMYARTWDRVDGALVMMPETIDRFEAAHEKASVALGESPVEAATPEEAAEITRAALAGSAVEPST